MRNRLGILLITYDVETSVFQTCKAWECVEADNKDTMPPWAIACAIFETAMPTAAANSGGSSDTLDICVFGMTSVCPGRSGKISVNRSWSCTVRSWLGTYRVLLWLCHPRTLCKLAHLREWFYKMGRRDPFSNFHESLCLRELWSRKKSFIYVGSIWFQGSDPLGAIGAVWYDALDALDAPQRHWHRYDPVTGCVTTCFRRDPWLL